LNLNKLVKLHQPIVLKRAAFLASELVEVPTIKRASLELSLSKQNSQKLSAQKQEMGRQRRLMKFQPLQQTPLLKVNLTTIQDHHDKDKGEMVPVPKEVSPNVVPTEITMVNELLEANVHQEILKNKSHPK
jgi:hypothetical protein